MAINDPGAAVRYVPENTITRETRRRCDIRTAHHRAAFERWKSAAHAAEAAAPKSFTGRAIDAKIPPKPTPSAWRILAALPRAERDRLAEVGRRERERKDRGG